MNIHCSCIQNKNFNKGKPKLFEKKIFRGNVVHIQTDLRVYDKQSNTLSV